MQISNLCDKKHKVWVKLCFGTVGVYILNSFGFGNFTDYVGMLTVKVGDTWGLSRV